GVVEIEGRARPRLTDTEETQKEQAVHARHFATHATSFLHRVGCATSRQSRRIDFRETLGRGGFGAVYLADVYGDNDFVQRLAVKLLSEEVSEHPDLVARQRDEARLLAQLNHDHTVKVLDL